MCSDIQTQYRNKNKTAEKRAGGSAEQVRGVEGRDYNSLVFYFIKGRVCKNTGNKKSRRREQY